ncbi:hypothetical protein ACQKQC_26060 [Vibrio fortis]|uniref:hypothetical protein n=1 Tax=Vibrio fortis TaxID=212667 RepID=UPI004068E551
MKAILKTEHFDSHEEALQKAYELRQQNIEHNIYPNDAGTIITWAELDFEKPINIVINVDVTHNITSIVTSDDLKINAIVLDKACDGMVDDLAPIECGEEVYIYEATSYKWEKKVGFARAISGLNTDLKTKGLKIEYNQESNRLGFITIEGGIKHYSEIVLKDVWPSVTPEQTENFAKVVQEYIDNNQ